MQLVFTGAMFAMIFGIPVVLLHQKIATSRSFRLSPFGSYDGDPKRVNNVDY
jgi:hypothetical protein